MRTPLAFSGISAELPSGPSPVYEHVDGVGDRYIWQFNEVGRPDLAVGLATYLAPHLAEDLAGLRVATVRQYRDAWSGLAKEMNRRGAAPDETLGSITPEDIKALDRPGSYSLLRCLIVNLRLIDENSPGLLSTALARRIGHIGSESSRTFVPREPFDPEFSAELKERADAHVKATIERIRQGRIELERLGSLPSRAWREDLVFRAMNGERLTTQDGQRLKHGERWFDVRETAEAPVMGLYDAVAFVIAIGLRTEIPIECIKMLKRDCLQNKARGFVDIVYLKGRGGRRPRTKRERVPDGGLTTPGGMIRAALEISAPAAKRLLDQGHEHADYLWLGWVERCLPSWRRFSLCPTAFKRGVAVLRGEPGPVSTLPNFSAARLRKTAKRDRYRRTSGHLRRFASDNSKGVAATRYANVRALDEDHANSITQAQRELLALAAGPTVLNELDENGVRTSDRPEDVSIARVLDGASDTWLGICRDFWSSPIDAAADGSCAATPSACLHCGNCVITARRLVPLFAYRNWLLEKRDVMGEDEWMVTYALDLVRIDEQILPRFSEEVREQAATRADKTEVIGAIPLHERRS